MLSTTRWVLNALLILNIVVGAILLLVLAGSFVAEAKFIATQQRVFPDADQVALLASSRWVLAIVAPVMLFAHILLRNLLVILETVRSGDPFAAANADRLQIVAWCLLAIQLCDIAFGFADAAMNRAAGEQISAWSPALTGWIAVLLVFVLARVFREGARLRDEAELTI
ncbi:DUF2975 domain-containing protein [Sphingomonas sp. LHG3443-2]|uniref:DUF2975 domain-containing protein n=1 Tax=Sphingomonas sp. LHG3443-2 TaxID=2804639 RepID=UPI003CF23B15